MVIVSVYVVEMHVRFELTMPFWSANGSVLLRPEAVGNFEKSESP